MTDTNQGYGKGCKKCNYQPRVRQEIIPNSGLYDYFVCAYCCADKGIQPVPFPTPKEKKMLKEMKKRKYDALSAADKKLWREGKYKPSLVADYWEPYDLT